MRRISFLLGPPNSPPIEGEALMKIVAAIEAWLSGAGPGVAGSIDWGDRRQAVFSFNVPDDFTVDQAQALLVRELAGIGRSDLVPQYDG